MKSYSQLLKEIKKERSAVFTFGRMNPPTKGHEENILSIIKTAQQQNARPFIFVSQSNDAKKNPLTHKQKLKYLRLGIPSAKKFISSDKKIRTPFDALGMLVESGFTNITFVVGDDRLDDFGPKMKSFLAKNHPDVQFTAVSSGARKATISGTKMRQAVADDNFAMFFKNVPSKLSRRFAEEMFQDVRKGLQLEAILENIRTINLGGLPREVMPQVPRANIPGFLKYIREKGIDVSKKEVPLCSLRPTQNKICDKKVRKKFDKFSMGMKPKPFIVSRDNYILDGHHQLYALLAGDSMVNVTVYKIELDMSNLLNIAKSYSGIRFEDLKSNPINKK